MYLNGNEYLCIAEQFIAGQNKRDMTIRNMDRWFGPTKLARNQAIH